MQSPVAEAFAAHLRADPAAPVACTVAGRFDRADLAGAAAMWLAQLAAVPRGARVALSVRDGMQFLAAMLAVWQHDACAILLDANEPRAPRTDLAARLGAAALLCDAPVPGCRTLGAGAPAGDLAAIKLTSGSTQEPRGVGVTAAQLIADCEALARTMGIDRRDRLLAAVPMSFSYGLSSLLMPALWQGMPLVLPDGGHPLGLVQVLRVGEPTVLPAVPSLVRALLAVPARMPPSLRLVLSAGGVLAPEVAAAFRRTFAQPVHAFYGASESGGITYDRTGHAAERGTVGVPVEGVDVALEAGRVCVHSPAVGSLLSPCPSLEDGVFRTPDLGEWRDGELVLLGRTGEAIDIDGHKVQPREVERVINELAAVTDVVVVPWSAADGRPGCAAVVASAELDQAAVRRHCVLRLPAAKVPRCIVVVPVLPRTHRGKLQRCEVDHLLAGQDSTMRGRLA